MARDFTYIDDVTSGVMAAMQYEPTRCGHVFNIGRVARLSFDEW